MIVANLLIYVTSGEITILVNWLICVRFCEAIRTDLIHFELYLFFSQQHGWMVP